MNRTIDVFLCVCLLGALCPAQTQPPLAIQLASGVKLKASDGVINDQFGSSVAISSNGNVVAVGAPGRNRSQGAAYVFVESGARWTSAIQTAELTVPGSDDEFGECVAISGNGDTVAVGTPGASAFQGAVYIFTATGGNPANGYTQTAVLNAVPERDANFGCGLAISSDGETVAVGGGLSTNQYQGAIYVFTEPSTGWSGTLTPDATLTASDGIAYQDLGNAVSISGNTIAAGAKDYPAGSGDPGAVYVFTKTGTTWISGTQTAKLTASDGAVFDQLGASVAISGNTIVAGAPQHTVGANAYEGALYVFVEPATGGWIDAVQTAELTAANGAAGADLGDSVAISGTVVVGGAYCQQIGSNPCQGELFAYEKPKTGWINGTETVDLTASGGNGGDELGYSSAMGGLVGVSGARGYSTGAYRGAVYVFQK